LIALQTGVSFDGFGFPHLLSPKLVQLRAKRTEVTVSLSGLRFVFTRFPSRRSSHEKFIAAGVVAALSCYRALSPASAATQNHFWHAMTGRSGELLTRQSQGFNASQTTTPCRHQQGPTIRKTLNAGIAASAAGRAADGLQVFEVGTATDDGSQGAPSKPVLMK